MKKTAGFLLVIAAAMILPVVVPGRFSRPGNAGAAPGEEKSGPKGWEIILENNIFLRDRGRRPEPPPEPPREIIRVEPPPAPVYRRTMVLTGLARDERGYLAFFENPETGRVTRVREGEIFLHGEIAGLSLNGALYLENEKSRVVGVGEKIEFTSSRPFPETSAVESPGQGVPGFSDAPDRQALLELMRQRRRQEIPGED